MWMPEVPSRGAGPQDVTAGGRRQTSDTLLQPPTTNHQQFRDRIPVREASYHKVAGSLVLAEEEQAQHAASHHYTPQQISNPHPPYQEGHRRHEEAFPGGMTQKELQENEELKKEKEKNKELQARFQQLLSKVMAMHENSENINDPSHLSAVLKMYEMLRLHDWEKFRSFSRGFSYKRGRSLIKKLFEACEKDIQQRTAKIFEVIGIPPSNDAMTNSKQGLMQAIRSVFRYSYYKNDSEFYSEIIMQSGVDIEDPIPKQFALQCCKTYCLLLLQEPPVEAVWEIEESSWQDLEHVDKTDRELWRKPVTVGISATLWRHLPPRQQHVVDLMLCRIPNRSGITTPLPLQQVTDNMSWDPARKSAFRKPAYSEKMIAKDPYWKYYGIEQDAIMK